MRRLRRRLLRFLGIAVLAYVGICALMFFTQRSLIYYPQSRANRAGVPVMILHTDAGPVLVSTRPAPGPGAVIYFGGNAEDVSLDLSDFSSAFPDDAIYLLHYRGYGGSAGKPSEQALFADALMLFDQVLAQHPNVILIGRSLGSGIAVKVASERPIQRLVLITPFDSLTDAAAQAYPWLPVRLLMHDKYDSWKYAPHVTAPTRILTAGNDEIIPRWSTERLRTRFKSGLATYTVIPGVGHNSISDSPDYLRIIAKP
ncbi:alpha/beta hydrolase [Occallatibacter riparius]|uniref:Alpha/beta hydrolase n=1 Tax=Occallatibacter riparius TaxID=1002689 RepID=A0A9J7BT25_9BACT|nr:lysophospholipase [Occallatibacter riparius]UWZ86028.1 alpha/beta hydrolase [Occallatibacter riparius]